MRNGGERGRGTEPKWDKKDGEGVSWRKHARGGGHAVVGEEVGVS